MDKALKTELKKVAKKIEALNSKIDEKIIAGKSFKNESAKHRDLVAYYNDLEIKALA